MQHNYRLNGNRTLDYLHVEYQAIDNLFLHGAWTTNSGDLKYPFQFERVYWLEKEKFNITGNSSEGWCYHLFRIHIKFFQIDHHQEAN